MQVTNTGNRNIAQRLELFESVLLGNTQAAAGAMLGMHPNIVHWECRKVFEMIVHGNLRDPMMEPPDHGHFGWRWLRTDPDYWQGQINYLKRHFGVEYSTPIVRTVIAPRFKTHRNVRIFERLIEGEKALGIANDHDLTVGAILQIWRLVARYCRDTAILNEMEPPSIPTLSKLRKEKKKWLKYLSMFKKTIEGK